MTAVSVAVGIAAGSQLPGTFQLPPAALFQRTAAALASEGCSSKQQSPTAVSRAIARNMMAPLRMGQGGSARGAAVPMSRDALGKLKAGLSDASGNVFNSKLTGGCTFTCSIPSTVRRDDTLALRS